MTGTIAPVEQQDSTSHRDPGQLARIRRLQVKVERAKAALEAATLTRDVEMMSAMDNGWTSPDIAEAIGVSPVAVRQMIYKRRTGRPGSKRRREAGGTS
jgi:response regulator of citrate/malate metabolism